MDDNNNNNNNDLNNNYIIEDTNLDELLKNTEITIKSELEELLGMNSETKLNMEELDNQIINVCDVFNTNSFSELLEYLETINPSKESSACTKALGKGSGAWTCEECSADSNCIICVECYERSKDIHKDHTVSFKPQVSGCCDCGDPDSWNPAGNCPAHKGIITEESEIRKLINELFSKEKLEKIEKQLDEFFFFTVKLFHYYNRLKNNDLNTSKQDSSNLINEQTSNVITCIVKAMKFIIEMSKSNICILTLIVDQFEKKHTVFTRHVCFDLNSIDEYIDDNFLDYNEDSHICTCNFAQNLIRNWTKNFDLKIKFEKYFMTMLNSKRFKIIYGLAYLSLYDKVLKNRSESIKSFSVQILTLEDLGEKIASSKMLLKHILKKFYLLVKQEIESINAILEKNCLNYSNSAVASSGVKFKMNFLYDILAEFSTDFYYLLKNKAVKLLSVNVEFFKIFLDTFKCYQNFNKLYYSNRTYIRDGLNEMQIPCEYLLLTTFNQVFSIFNLEKTSLVNELIVYNISLILDSKNYLTNINYSIDNSKNNLKNDKNTSSNIIEGSSNGVNRYFNREFSFHITLHRALSIIVNRYALYLSFILNMNIVDCYEKIFRDSYESIQANNSSLLISDKHSKYNKYDKSSKYDKQETLSFDDFILTLFLPLLKTVSFINSISSKNWVYYGENCLYFYYYYYSVESFALIAESDFALIKVFLSLKINYKKNKEQEELSSKETNTFVSEYLKLAKANDNSNDIVSDSFLKKIVKKILETAIKPLKCGNRANQSHYINLNEGDAKNNAQTNSNHTDNLSFSNSTNINKNNNNNNINNSSKQISSTPKSNTSSYLRKFSNNSNSKRKLSLNSNTNNNLSLTETPVKEDNVTIDNNNTINENDCNINTEAGLITNKNNKENNMIIEEEETTDMNKDTSNNNNNDIEDINKMKANYQLNLFNIIEIMDIFDHYNPYLFSMCQGSLLIPNLDTKAKMHLCRNLEVLIYIYTTDLYIPNSIFHSQNKIADHKVNDWLLQPFLIKHIFKQEIHDNIEVFDKGKNSKLDTKKYQQFSESEQFKNFSNNYVSYNLTAWKENLTFSEIYKKIPNWLNEVLIPETCEKTLEEIATRITQKNKPIKFTLKKQLYKNIDLYNFIDPYRKSYMERFILETLQEDYKLLSKNNNSNSNNGFEMIHLNNTKDNYSYISDFFKSFSTNTLCNYSFLSSLINFVKFHLAVYEDGDINKEFYLSNILLKLVEIIIANVMKLDSEDVGMENINNVIEFINNEVFEKDLIAFKDKCGESITQTNIESLLKNINNLKVSLLNENDENDTDINKKELSKEVENKEKGDSKDNTTTTNNIYDNNNEVKQEEINETKPKTLTLKEKMALKFKNKTNKFKESNVNDVKELEAKAAELEKKQKESYICSICLQHSNGEMTESLCRIGYLSKNSTTYKGREKDTNEFSTYLVKTENLFHYVITCQHYVHHSCWNNSYFNHFIYAGNNDSFIFVCPLCKKLSNTLIPIANEVDSGLIKQGLNFSSAYYEFCDSIKANEMNLSYERNDDDSNYIVKIEDIKDLLSKAITASDDVDYEIKDKEILILLKLKQLSDIVFRFDKHKLEISNIKENDNNINKNTKNREDTENKDLNENFDPIILEDNTNNTYKNEVNDGNRITQSMEIDNKSNIINNNNEIQETSNINSNINENNKEDNNVNENTGISQIKKELSIIKSNLENKNSIVALKLQIYKIFTSSVELKNNKAYISYKQAATSFLEKLLGKKVLLKDFEKDKISTKDKMFSDLFSYFNSNIENILVFCINSKYIDSTISNIESLVHNTVNFISCLKFLLKINAIPQEYMVLRFMELNDFIDKSFSLTSKIRKIEDNDNEFISSMNKFKKHLFSLFIKAFIQMILFNDTNIDNYFDVRKEIEFVINHRIMFVISKFIKKENSSTSGSNINHQYISEHLISNFANIEEELSEFVICNLLSKLCIIKLFLSNKNVIMKNDVLSIVNYFASTSNSSGVINNNKTNRDISGILSELNLNEKHITDMIRNKMETIIVLIGSINSHSNDNNNSNITSEMEVEDSINFINTESQQSMDSKNIISQIILNKEATVTISNNKDIYDALKELLTNNDKKDDSINSSTAYQISLLKNVYNKQFILANSSNYIIKLIDLPNNVIQLFEKYYQIKCKNCDTNPTFSLLCLVCGEKVCFMKTCCNEYGKKKNTFEYIYHMKECGLGNGVYLSLEDGKISYMINNAISPTNIYLYTNKFYEHPNNKKISTEYKLDSKLYSQVEEEFISYKSSQYLKKGVVMRDEEEEDVELEDIGL